MFLITTAQNAKLANWVKNQRQYDGWQQERKKSSMTLSRIQELESLGSEWKPTKHETGMYITARKVRLSELADYRKMHGHRNVPNNYSAKSQTS